MAYVKEFIKKIACILKIKYTLAHPIKKGVEQTSNLIAFNDCLPMKTSFDNKLLTVKKFAGKDYIVNILPKKPENKKGPSVETD